MTPLTFNVLGVPVRVDCAGRFLRGLVLDNWAGLSAPVGDGLPLHYTLSHAGERFTLTIPGGERLLAEDDGELLFLLEKDLTIRLQYARSELYFLHAAALALNGEGLLLLAPSGSGKSTTTWGLLRHGFDYLSDELAPVDTLTWHVHPYPHAICLKQPPPPPYLLPDETRTTRRTLHVPTARIGAVVQREPVPLKALLFVQYLPDQPISVAPVSPGEAAARLYANALNQLAHPHSGLEAAAELALHCPAFRVTTGRDLERVANQIREVMDDDATPGGEAIPIASGNY